MKKTKKKLNKTLLIKEIVIWSLPVLVCIAMCIFDNIHWLRKLLLTASAVLIGTRSVLSTYLNQKQGERLDAQKERITELEEQLKKTASRRA